MRWHVVALAGALIACTAGAGYDDAGTIDAHAVDDALADARPPPGDAQRDAFPPIDNYAPFEWERTVAVSSTEDPIVRNAVALPAGIALLATPELALYDAKGEELGRAPAPPSTSWTATVGVARTSGDLAVAYVGPGSEYIVKTYDGTDLTEKPSIATSITGAGAALAEHNGALFLLARAPSAPYTITLYELNDAGIERSVALGPGTGYSVHGPGLSLGDGRIAFCVEKGMSGSPPLYKPTILYVDPVADTMTSLDLGVAGSGGTCRLVRAGDRIFAQWQEPINPDGDFESAWGGAYLDAADGSVVMGPVRHTMYNLSGTEGIGYTGTHFILGSGEWIYPIDAETLEPLPRLHVTMHEDEYIPGPGRANAGDGTAGYVAIAPALGLGPVVLRLQRLEPFTTP